VVQRSSQYVNYHFATVCVFGVLGVLFSWLESRVLGFSEGLSHLAEWELGTLTVGGLITTLPIIARRLISSQTLERAVHARALKEFYKQGIHQTQASTGILIFVSEFERRVQILADSGINKKVSPETWDKQVKDIVAGIKTGNSGVAVARAIEEMGNLLALHFPAMKNNTNDLPNRPITE